MLSHTLENSPFHNRDLMWEDRQREIAVNRHNGVMMAGVPPSGHSV